MNGSDAAANQGGTLLGLRDILVHLDGSDAAESRLDIAVDLARRHAAHVIAIFVVDLQPETRSLKAMYGFSPAMETWLWELEATTMETAGRVRDAFEARCGRDGVSGEWRQMIWGQGDSLVTHARYADLAVLGQPDPKDIYRTGREYMVEEVLFSSGRPVLLVPYAGRFTSVGRKVLVAWNAGREAARAVNDALPLLAAAQETTLLAIDPDKGSADHGESPCADIALHLARHGVHATATRTFSGGLGAGDVLLNTATDLGVDLLVMGAYGHSRVHELVLGGATRTILQHATIPVLMSR